MIKIPYPRLRRKKKFPLSAVELRRLWFAAADVFCFFCTEERLEHENSRGRGSYCQLSYMLIGCCSRS
jgi:hypothetical protein